MRAYSFLSIVFLALVEAQDCACKSDDTACKSTCIKVPRTELKTSRRCNEQCSNQSQGSPFDDCYSQCVRGIIERNKNGTTEKNDPRVATVGFKLTHANSTFDGSSKNESSPNLVVSRGYLDSQMTIMTILYCVLGLVIGIYQM